MGIMYLCLIYSIAELSAALPYSGGFYSFTRYAFGPLAGFICGASTIIEYVLTPAVIVFYISSSLNPLLPGVPIFIWWLLFYAIFVTINIRSVELTLNVGLFLTIMAAAILVIFFYGALTSGEFNFDLLFNLPPSPGQSATWLPKGWLGVFKAFPYAIWFYLAIEQLPLAAEEAEDVAKDIPESLIWGIYTLLAFALYTLVLNSGVAGGAVAIGKSSTPLADGLKAVFGEGFFTKVLTVLAVTGLVASFHAIIYAYGRCIFSLSRAGYLPRWLSVTSKSHTPARALILGAVIGLICTEAIQISGQGIVGAALLNMAVFGAVISYAAVMLSYIKLSVSHPELPRPYKSPLGVWGATVGTVLAILALFACFSDPLYQPGIWGVAIFLIAAVLYFLLYSRTKLVAQAPEEKAALLPQRHREKEGGGGYW